MDRRIHALLLILGGLHQILAQCTSDPAERDHHRADYNGICYEFINVDKTWEDAVDECDKLAGETNLATIVDAAHDMWIKEMMVELQYSSLWTGLHRLEPSEDSAVHWQWIQEEEPLYYQGCYEWEDTGINDYSSVNYETPLKCIARCIEKGKDYAAIGYLEDENKDHILTCRCDDTFLARNPRSGRDDCTMECEEDPSQLCGSNDHGRVYSTKAVGEGVTSDSFWRARQPNNADDEQHCIALDHVSDRNFWYSDEKCYGVNSQDYGHICQYDLSESRCEDEGFTYFHINSTKCYKVFDNDVTNSWYEARAACLSQGGDLASIKYRDFFDSLVENDLMDKVESSDRWWIGGTNEIWQWQDGSAMVYTMFAKDEPNVAHNKNCVMKKLSAGFGWTMQDCDQVKPFFCQLSTPTTTTSTTTSTTTTTTPTTTTPNTTTPTTATTSTTTKSTTTTTVATSKGVPTTTTSTTTTTTTTTPASTTTTTTPAPTTTTTTPAPTTTTTTTKKANTEDPAETTSQKATTTTTKDTTTKKGENTKTTTTTKTTKDTATQPAKTTTTKGVPNSKTPTARRMVTTQETTEENTLQPGNGEEQTGDDDDDLSTGIIVAIAVAAVAVFAGFIRLLVFCCQRKSSYDDHDQSINNSTKGLATSDYNNPAFSDGYDTGGKGEIRPMESSYITPENGELTPTTNETFAY